MPASYKVTGVGFRVHKSWSVFTAGRRSKTDRFQQPGNETVNPKFAQSPHLHPGLFLEARTKQSSGSFLCILCPKGRSSAWRPFTKVLLLLASTVVGLVKGTAIWEFPKIGGGPYFGVLIIRIPLCRVLYWGPLFSETKP